MTQQGNTLRGPSAVTQGATFDVEVIGQGTSVEVSTGGPATSVPIGANGKASITPPPGFIGILSITIGDDLDRKVLLIEVIATVT